MDSTGVDEQRIQRWLELLRDGGEADKVGARRGLARVFEQRGMVAEAIELLETNVQAGACNAATLRWLSRLYQAQGDEARSFEAAVSASQHLVASPGSEPPTVDIQAGPTQPRMIRHPLPYILMLVGLGIAVGVVLWLFYPP